MEYVKVTLIRNEYRVIQLTGELIDDTMTVFDLKYMLIWKIVFEKVVVHIELKFGPMSGYQFWRSNNEGIYLFFAVFMHTFRLEIKATNKKYFF